MFAYAVISVLKFHDNESQITLQCSSWCILLKEQSY
jgi:hypothetical protein